MRKLIMFVFLLFAPCLLFSQEIESILNDISKGIDDVTEQDDRANYSFILSKMKDNYKDLSKFYCISDFNFYRENCRFVYAYNPLGKVVFMFFSAKKEGQKKLYVYRVRIDAKDKECLKYVTNAKQYKEYLQKWNSVKGWSEIEKTEYPKCINNYIREVLIFNPQYIDWLKKDNVKETTDNQRVEF